MAAAADLDARASRWQHAGMGMLAFFPWLDLDEEVRLQEFSLIRFERGGRPGGGIQPTLDAVLELYVVGDDRPIPKATLLQLPGGGITDDLDDDVRNDLFALGELIALAGLAKRQYFAPFHYANRDNFTLIIQAFSDPTGGVAVRNRRRDGSTHAYKSRGGARVRRPDHVAAAGGVQIDVPLLEALLKLRSSDRWPDFEEAIFFFNRANTDGNDVFEQAEIVSTTSAFERVLGCRSGKEQELAERFVDEWRQSRCLLPSGCARIPAGQKQHVGKSIAELWIRDFFRHRGNVGHGRKQTAHPALWSAEEHLLLGAYAFPLLLKMLLNKLGLYRESWEEQVDVDVFEELACTKLFAEVREERDDGKEGQLVWPWGEIRGRARLRRALEIAFDRALEAESVE
jgi:hypothetical protein